MKSPTKLGGGGGGGIFHDVINAVEIEGGAGNTNREKGEIKGNQQQRFLDFQAVTKRRKIETRVLTKNEYDFIVSHDF